MIIDNKFLDELSSKAAENDRLRINYNLHETLNDEVQRLLNALEPGTVLPVHRHRNTAETYFVLRGKLEVLIYDDEKTLVEKVPLAPDEGSYGMHVPPGQWHTINVLEKGTVIFEVKKGPYIQLSREDILEIE